MKNNQLQKKNNKNWKYIQLGDLAKTSSGGTPKSDNTVYYENGTIPWLTSGEVRKGKISNFNNFITKQGLINSSAKIFPIGTTLVAMYGATAGQVGILEKEASTNQALCGILPNEQYSSLFLYYYFTTKTKQLLMMGTGAAQPNISQDILKSLDINFPPLSEQNRIVSVLEAWDQSIEKISRKIKIKERIKKELMRDLLTGKKRLRGFVGTWQIIELGSLGEYYSGITGKNKEDFGFGKPFISYMNIYSNPKIDTNIKDLVNIKPGDGQNTVKYGDLFFTTSSETPDEVGVSSVLLDKNVGEVYLNSFCFGFRLHNFTKLIPEFAQHYFRTRHFRKSMFEIAQGASRFNLSKKYFVKIKIKIPDSTKEQTAIASILNTADNELDFLNQKLTLLKSQKKFLLNNLITGKIRTPETLSIKK